MMSKITDRNKTMSLPLRVAVVGAGAAGLCALRHLTARPSLFKPQCFEQLENVGGTWNYSSNSHNDSYGTPISSSIYKNCVTNLPKEIAAFPDFPFPADLPSFMHNSHVKKYLYDYCEHFHLRNWIQFGKKIANISVGDIGDKNIWNVTVESVLKDESQTQEFDAVIVCNGQYTIPYTPDIPGQDIFKGIQLHSHDYKTPDKFDGLKVVVLGASSSGVDIGLELSTHAESVIISHNKYRLKTKLPVNCIEKVGIKELMKSSVIFKDGTELDTDVVLYCTGYKRNFTFLTGDCELYQNDGRVHNLYKHIIHTKYPTISFIGNITNRIVPLPHFHIQIQYVLAVLDGSMKLPGEIEMEQAIERDYKTRIEKYGLRNCDSHLLSDFQWDYNDELCKEIGIETLPPYYEKIYKFTHDERVNDLCSYKRYNFKVTGSDSFEFSKDSTDVNIDK